MQASRAKLAKDVAKGKAKEEAAAKLKANPDRKPPKSGGRGTANYHVDEKITGAFFASKSDKKQFRLEDTDNNRQHSRRQTMATHLKENRFYFTQDLGQSKPCDVREKALLQSTCPFVGRRGTSVSDAIRLVSQVLPVARAWVEGVAYKCDCEEGEICSLCRVPSRVISTTKGCTTMKARQMVFVKPHVSSRAHVPDCSSSPP